MINSPKLLYRDLYQCLEELLSQANSQIILVAPFVKYKIIENLFNRIPEVVQIDIITRWRLEEILVGVSDIEIWEIVKSRKKCTLKLHSDLHAKYYRCDNVIMVGSANLTQKALIENNRSNLEILYQCEVNDESKNLEKLFFSQSILVTEELYNNLKLTVENCSRDEIVYTEIEPNFDPQQIKNSHDFKNTRICKWYPKSRNPENLYKFYNGNKKSLTEDQIKHAKEDLLNLGIVKGLKEEQFYNFMRFNLSKEPFIIQLNNFLEKPRRFGEISQFLDRKLKLSEKGINPKRSWQTFMRWLLYFFSDKYDYFENNYSEVFYRRN